MPHWRWFADLVLSGVQELKRLLPGPAEQPELKAASAASAGSRGAGGEAKGKGGAGAAGAGAGAGRGKKASAASAAMGEDDDVKVRASFDQYSALSPTRLCLGLALPVAVSSRCLFAAYSVA